MEFIQPRVLKGFRDFLPLQELSRRAMIEKIENSFRLFGFVPIDTPALEYAEILLGKGGGETEKQIYRFTDHGGRDVALRFDLTVPFARFIAEHRGEIALPFKRYHIAKVWRGENTQRGRYREFTQCDFDIVGSSGAEADFEILLMIRNTMQALCGDQVVIRLNHRGLFNRFLSTLGVREQSVEILRRVDKLAKIGKEEVGRQLEEITGSEKSRSILAYITMGTDTAFDNALEKLKEASGEGEDILRLEALGRFMKDAGAEDGFILDTSITRGLDYYTGVVYETFLKNLPEIGSVCSGGRYDNLAGLYSKEPVCGVGASIGLDRLQAALEELHALEGRNGGVASCNAALACIEAGNAGKAQKTAELFRRQNISCEVFLEPQKLTQQFILAEKKNIPWILIPDNAYTLFTARNIALRKNHEGLDINAAIELIKTPI